MSESTATSRRELFRRLAAAAAAGTIPSIARATAVPPPAPVPALVILEMKHEVSHDDCENILKFWRHAVADTAFANVTPIVLSEGLSATFLGADGRVLNPRIWEEEMLL